MVEENHGEQEVLAELHLVPGEGTGEDLLSIPQFMQATMMAVQRQTWRNTAVQARDMAKVALACGDKDGATAWEKQMGEAISRIVQIDAQCPTARERMRELDDLAEQVQRAQSLYKGGAPA